MQAILGTAQAFGTAGLWNQLRNGALPAAAVGSNLFAEATRVILAPLVVLLTVRYLQSESYGHFATAQTAVIFTGSVINLGFSYSVLVRSSRDGLPLRAVYATALPAALGVSVLLYFVLAIWTAFAGYTAETRIVALILGGTLATNTIGAVFGAGLQSEKHFHALAIRSAGTLLLTLVSAIVAIALDGGIYAIAFGQLFATAFTAAQLAWLHRAHWAFQPSFPKMLRFWGTGLPFGISDSIASVYLSIDLVLISILLDERSVGVYSVPVRLVAMTYMIPTVVNRVLYPDLFKWSRTDTNSYWRAFDVSVRSLFVAGLACAIALALAAPLLPLVLGNDFHEATWLLLILLCGVPVRFVLNAFATVMATADRVWTKACAQLAAVAINVSLNIILLPAFGIRAAAATTVLTDLILLPLYLTIVRGAKRASQAGAEAAHATA